MAQQDPEVEAEVAERMRGVRLLCLDVDGVLTDGGLHYDDHGGEGKVFCTQDGQALKMLRSTGVDCAIITGRRSGVVQRRARELSIGHLYEGVEDKRTALAELCPATGLGAKEIAHVGDDIPDLPLFRRVGLACAPRNLHPALRPFVHLVTDAAGGDGAVREVCERIMRAQDTWDDALAPYLE